MKELMEKMEQIEEIMQLVTTKLAAMEKKWAAQAEVNSPDYTGRLDQIDQRLKNITDIALQLEKLHAVMQAFSKEIKELPAKIPQRQPVSFDLRSKGFVIGSMILLSVTAIASGLSLSLWSENRLMYRRSLEYRMIRVEYPGVVTWADSTYYRNPGEAERITSQNEDLIFKQQQPKDSPVNNSDGTKPERKHKGLRRK